MQTRRGERERAAVSSHSSENLRRALEQRRRFGQTTELHEHESERFASTSNLHVIYPIHVLQSA